MSLKLFEVGDCEPPGEPEAVFELLTEDSVVPHGVAACEDKCG